VRRKNDATLIDPFGTPGVARMVTAGDPRTLPGKADDDRDYAEGRSVTARATGGGNGVAAPGRASAARRASTPGNG